MSWLSRNAEISLVIAGDSLSTAITSRSMFPLLRSHTQKIICIQHILIVEALLTLTLPWALRLAQRFPVLLRIPVRLIGIGFRPGQERTREVRVPVDTSAAAD